MTSMACAARQIGSLILLSRFGCRSCGVLGDYLEIRWASLGGARRWKIDIETLCVPQEVTGFLSEISIVYMSADVHESCVS